MKWANEYCEEWQRKFALLPKSIKGGHTIWLQHYWQRYVPKNDGMVVGVWELVDSEQATKELATTGEV